MLAHAAFFEKLESLHEFGEEWRSALAGLLVLRLVDACLDAGSCQAGTDTGAVREALSNVPDRDPTGPLLRDILERVEQPEHPHIQTVAPALQRYADALDRRSEWALAHDVFDTSFRWAHAANAFPTAVQAGIAATTLLRTLGRCNASDAIMPLVEACASRLPDDVGYLRCQIGRVSSYMYRGRANEAMRRLDALTPRIQAANNDYLQVCAAHLWLQIAWQTRRTSEALQLGYKALALTMDASLAESLRNRIAATHMVAGQYDVAHDMLVTLADSSISEFSTVALVNLAEVAIARSDKKMFDYYRSQSRVDGVIPSNRAQFHYIIGMGHRRFGRYRQSIDEMREAVRLAKQYDDVLMRRRAARRLKAWGDVSALPGRRATHDDE